jgi:hypothetical protein
VKDLAGVERHRQIKARCRNLDQFHTQNISKK